MLALTTEPASVVRAGYEAVYARRPLIVSAWSNLRQIFPYAVHVSNDSDSIVSGLELARDRLDELRATTADALREQRQRWDGQLVGMHAALRSEPNGVYARAAAGTSE